MLLLLNRAFFSLQRVWLPTWVALGNLVLNTVLLLVLYDTAGVWGIPLATSISNLATVVVSWRLLRDRVGDLELHETLASLALVAVASGLLAAVAWATWTVARRRARPVDRGAGHQRRRGLAAGAAAYLGACAPPAHPRGARSRSASCVVGPRRGAGTL